ncbi:MAG TPA: hypothetical protein VKV05_12055 [Terriglobales bacterium]|nr:hypothetical protein [Terriglobales bacterium]
MSSRYRILLAVVLLLSASLLLHAQIPTDIPLSSTHSDDTEPAQIHELVSSYCRLDYEGARLDPQAWSKFQPLVWWETNPPYTQIDVVARYAVDMPPDATHGKYDVTVHYRLLGVYDMANGYVREPQGTTQNVDFLVVSQKTDWRIGDAENTYPHPSRAAMLMWLTKQISTTQDPAAKARYQNALKQLQAQSASPFAK